MTMDMAVMGADVFAECRFYPKYGRIEDEEVIEKHKELVKRHIQENSIVEPPDMDSDEARDFFQRHPWALGI